MLVFSRKTVSFIIFMLLLTSYNEIVRAQTRFRLERKPSTQKTHIKDNAMKDKKSDPSIIDIWTWQKEHAFVQGRVINATGKIIFCAGQTSVDENGNPVNAGDMAAQIKQALDNLEAVLAKGGAKLKDVVRMTYYVKDIPAFLQSNSILLKRYTESTCNPATSLIGVAALFHPDILFEVEATAVVQ